MDELANRVSQHIETYFKSYQTRLETLQSDKPPTILFVACVDARVVPEMMLNVEPGDMMTLRVPGAIVPPQGLGDVCVAGTIELVLDGLPSVKDIVVCGHTSCAFNERLAEGVDSYELSSLARWVAMADFARAQASTKADKQSDSDGYRQALLEFTVQRSLQALREIPIVKKREKAGELNLHGWYFNLATGQVMVFDEKTQVFEAASALSENVPTAVEKTTTIPVTETSKQKTSQAQSQTTASQKAKDKSDTTGQQSATEKTTTAPTPSAVPSVAPTAVAAAHQAASFDAKAPESVAPSPVNVPSAKPVERVYASEVSRAPSQSKEVAKQQSSKPAQQRQQPSRPSTSSQRSRQSTSSSSRPQATKGNGRGASQQAADGVQSVLDQQMLKNIGDLLQDVRRPAQRMRLRNMLNQVKSPQGWETVRTAVSTAQNSDVRQALRELSIELASPEARSELRGIISQLGNDVVSAVTENVDMSQVEQDFMSILNNLRAKDD